MVITPASIFAQSVCGNGVTEPGEQCDVADTPSGTDECDGCNNDCTITEECGRGPCMDGMDNDSDGVADERDPKCSSLYSYSTFGLLATEPRREALRMGAETRVQESAAEAGASLCGGKLSMRSLATVDGSVTITGEAQFSHRFSSGIGGKFVTGAGAVPNIPRAPVLVGAPMGTCSVSAGPCLSPLDCVDTREECSGRLKLNAVNPSVDVTGTGVGTAEFDRCLTGLTDIPVVESALSVLGDTTTEDSLKVKARGFGLIDIGPGVTVLSYQSVRLLTGATLTINGSARSGLVIRVANKLRLLGRARIELTGGIEPGNVLWIVNGRGGGVLMDNSSSFQGFLWAPQRAVLAKRKAQFSSALVGRRVRMSRGAQLEHVPLQMLLPSTVQLVATTSPERVSSSDPLTYNLAVTNDGPAWAGVVNVSLALDAQTTFTSATPSQGRCLHDGSATGGTVVCFLGHVADPLAAPANQASVQVVVGMAPGTTQLNATATLNHFVSSTGDTIVPISTVVAP